MATSSITTTIFLMITRKIIVTNNITNTITQMQMPSGIDVSIRIFQPINEVSLLLLLLFL